MTVDPLLDPGWRALLLASRRATLATTRADGAPRLVPCCFALGEDTGVTVIDTPVDEKPKTSDDPMRLARVRDILADPRVALLVDRWDEDWRGLAWLRVDGRARILDPRAEPHQHALAVAALRERYPQYRHHRLDALPIIRVTPSAVRAWHADEPADGLVPAPVLRFEPDLGSLVARARELATSGSGPDAVQRILGITGPPGAGKSTLARAVVDAIGHGARYLPMDGFHLANAELRRLGRQDRKGAPDTFDAAGYAAVLRRLREHGRDTVYAPAFDRSIEESVAGAIPIDPDVPLVVTEGNYVLLDQGPWAAVRQLVDEVWYLEPDDERRIRRLVDRHIRYGRTRAAAEEWVHRSDEANTVVVAGTRDRADLVVLELEDVLPTAPKREPDGDRAPAV